MKEKVDLKLVAEEAGDDNLGDVRGVGTTAGHTHITQNNNS